MADVFISYIHEEENVAKALQWFLRDQLVKNLLSKREFFLSANTWQVIAGEIWLDRIMEELKSARVVILLLSRRSVSRPWVNFEAGAAWGLKRKIIPACFGGLLKDGLPKPYSNIQALDLEDESYYLLRSVSHWLNESSFPPPWEPGDAPDSCKRLMDEIQKYKHESATTANDLCIHDEV